MSRKKLWIGRIMGAFAVLFLLFDSAIHFTKITSVVEAFAGLGYSMDLAVPIAIIELICIVLYIIPRTSILGAILLTGYLGGAVASNLRVHYSLFGNILFPVYIGILLWGALYARDERLRALFPLRKNLP